MSSVRARFYLTEVTRTPYYTGGETKEAARIKMGAAQGEPFGPATPQGNIDMLIVNPAAAKIFLDAPIHQQFDILLTPLNEGEAKA